MNERKDVEELIRKHGGKLVRAKKHHVWRFPDGRNFVMSNTPSDIRADRNNIMNLYKFLGIEREIIKNPDRVQKQGVKKKISSAGADKVTLRDWKTELKKIRLFKPKQLCVEVVNGLSDEVILRQLRESKTGNEPLGDSENDTWNRYAAGRAPSGRDGPGWPSRVETFLRSQLRIAGYIEIFG
jgi:hypothetical protein